MIHTFTDEQLAEHDRLIGDAVRDLAIEIIQNSPTYRNHSDHVKLCYCAMCSYIRGNVTEIRARTPSTAQSREREIRADELLILWQRDYVCNGGYGPGYLTPKGHEWIMERRAELSASSHPKGCTCDRTGWPGSASTELHEVNCPGRKDGRKS